MSRGMCRGFLAFAAGIAVFLFSWEVAAAAGADTGAAAGQRDRVVKPEDVLLVASSAWEGSEELARYYGARRAVPQENLFILELPTTEDIDRECFNTKLRDPLRKRVHEQGGHIRGIVLFCGVPLSIWDPAQFNGEISTLKQKLAGIKEGTFQSERQLIEAQLRDLEKRSKEAARNAASVDSELALLWREHPLEGWVESPFLRESGWPEGCYQVARLDASSIEDVKSMIDGALEAEAKGLKGIAYFDARGLDGTDGYSEADRAIRQAARIAGKRGFATVVDNRPELFAPGECPEAAIYWGWYSLARYVDSCRFVPGVIAVHIASGECNSLREGTYWCRNLIARGAAVTMGPTQEPYLTAFPKADEFLKRVFEGESVGEAYYETAPWLSWRMVLLGDPLYRPFGNRRDAGSQARKGDLGSGI